MHLIKSSVQSNLISIVRFIFFIPGEKIPPNSTLIFDCELVKIDDGPKPANVFREIDTDGNKELSKDEVRSNRLAVH